MFYVYVLISEKHNRHYIGMTNDVERRLAEHNVGKTKSTSYYAPWKILFRESFNTREDARNREKYLKSGNRKRIYQKMAP
jgi:putative endonuclease